jgi:hypothetical protein
MLIGWPIAGSFSGDFCGMIEPESNQGRIITE